MNFFKKMMGYSTDDLKTLIEKTTIKGTFYRVIKDTRNIIFQETKINFEHDLKDYFIKFTSETEEGQKTYAFPIYVDMNLVTFEMKKKGMVNSCFEWTLNEGDHVGCYMNPNDQEKFQDIACRVLKILFDDDNIKDHMKLCKHLEGIPSYKAKQSEEVHKSTITMAINDVLIKEAGKKENVMVNSGIEYEIFQGERKLKNKEVVFALKEIDKFMYEVHLINGAGYTYLKKELTPLLVYEINTEIGYFRWLHDKESYTIVEVNFDGKRDVAMSLRFAILQCQYEQNTKRKLQDAVAEDQITYMRRISDKVETPNKIVKTYEDLQEELEMEEEKFVYGYSEAEKGLEKYLNLCQGKVHNIDVASLGSMLQILKISENNEVKQIQKKKIQSKEPISINNIHLHDSDSKAVLNAPDGRLRYYDLEKGKIVQEYDMGPKGIQSICPQYKLAETTEFKTFKAVSPSEIFEIDPRLNDPTVNVKKYQTNPDFNKISVDAKGRYAVASTNGEIRLYDKIGKNSNCKYPALGDPVLHLDSTKDGKWLLATFKTYLLLLPTETEDEINLYENKVKIVDRPQPIKLKIKLQHIQMCRVKTLEMVPAKFEERKDGKQRFIVSGFDEIVVIWNLAHVIRGNVNSYRFTNIGGNLIQTDFMFNNVKKLLMTTNKGIIIKQNKVE